MAETRPRLLQDFLIPHLNRGTFYDKLCWVNRSEGTFRIFWRHQSSSRFSPEDSLVFEAWATAKGLWDPNDEKKLTKAKQRLRAALLKLRTVECIKKKDEYRTYKIISHGNTENAFQHSMDPIVDLFLEQDHEIFIDHLLRTPLQQLEPFDNFIL